MDMRMGIREEERDCDGNEGKDMRMGIKEEEWG